MPLDCHAKTCEPAAGCATAARGRHPWPMAKAERTRAAWAVTRLVWRCMRGSWPCGPCLQATQPPRTTGYQLCVQTKPLPLLAGCGCRSSMSKVSAAGVGAAVAAADTRSLACASARTIRSRPARRKWRVVARGAEGACQLERGGRREASGGGEQRQLWCRGLAAGCRVIRCAPWAAGVYTRPENLLQGPQGSSPDGARALGAGVQLAKRRSSSPTYL